MFSTLRKGLVYHDVSTDIMEHDIDIDADLWEYDGKDVYRGTVDPRYSSHGLNVYSLYDVNLKRVGLAEHDVLFPEQFKALWIHDNPYATLFQDPRWKKGQTFWSMISNEAYQDCLEDDFETVSDRALQSSVLLITPDILKNKPDIYICEKCNVKSLVHKDVCPHALAVSLDLSKFSVLFMDDHFVVYDKPTMPEHDDDVPEQQSKQEQSVDQESQDAQLPLADSPLPQPLPSEQS